MTKNILEGAKFGDKFVTRDRRIVCYTSTVKMGIEIQHWFATNNAGETFCVDNNGITFNSYHDYDIVSRYQETINEEFLNSIGLTKENNYCTTIELPRTINHYTATIFVNNETKCWQIKRNIISNGIESIYNCYIGILYNKEDVTKAIELCGIDINLFKNLASTLQ